MQVLTQAASKVAVLLGCNSLQEYMDRGCSTSWPLVPITGREVVFYRWILLTDQAELHEWGTMKHRGLITYIGVCASGSSHRMDWREIMSSYPINGMISSISDLLEQAPPNMSEATYFSWQWDRGRKLFSIPSLCQDRRIIIALNQGLDWREVMSWYAISGETFTSRSIAPQEPWRIDACFGWHWDPVGFVDDRFNQILAWDPGIKGSVHGGLTQRQGII